VVVEVLVVLVVELVVEVQVVVIGAHQQMVEQISVVVAERAVALAPLLEELVVLVLLYLITQTHLDWLCHQLVHRLRHIGALMLCISLQVQEQ
jgi:hypothetical protein